nr:MAG TPA: hypothetical protein [Caudoviricetes sp.]
MQLRGSDGAFQPWFWICSYRTALVRQTSRNTSDSRCQGVKLLRVFLLRHRFFSVAQRLGIRVVQARCYYKSDREIQVVSFAFAVRFLEKKPRQSGVLFRSFFSDLVVNFPQANTTTCAEVSEIIQTGPLANPSASSLHKYRYLLTPP